jgi:hypothetical protein
LQPVESQQRISPGTVPEGCVDQWCAIRSQTCLLANLICNALGRFKNSVKMVFLYQFRLAKMKDVGVDTPPLQFASEPSCSFGRLRKGCRFLYMSELSVLAELPAGKGKDFIERMPAGVEQRPFLAIVDGRHGPLNEIDYRITASILRLPGYQGFEQSVPLGQRRIRIGNSAGMQQASDFTSRQTFVRHTEDVAK